MSTFYKLIFFTTIVTIFSQNSLAGVVFEQMSTDFKTLQAGIESSLQRIKDKEDKIIEKTLSENKGEDLLGYVITSSAVRVTSFRLQGVIRLLNASPSLPSKKGKDIEILYRNIKTVEDSIGKMDEALTTLGNASKKGASEKKIKDLRKKADQQSKLVAKYYKQIGWLKNDAAEKSIDKILFLNQMSPNEESKIIRSAIASEIKTFQQKISNELLPGMRDQKFSHDSMEYNFHEFRREIRWVAIYFSSLPGLFSLKTYTLDGYTPEQQEILKEYKGNKYAEIDSENAPIVIERYTFYNLANYIQLAGNAKDIAEEHFKLIEAGVDSELDENQFKNDMVKMMTAFINSGTFEDLLQTIE
ncbi:MAG: hypothetical protein IT287_01450 [Bdellovibrionaceae bacterium]|nr:hypothetical protein [Pseudobdellovibrionaceae bacterium]